MGWDQHQNVIVMGPAPECTEAPYMEASFTRNNGNTACLEAGRCTETEPLQTIDEKYTYFGVRTDEYVMKNKAHAA